MAMTEMRSADVITALDEAPLGRVHMRAVVASGVGFFTDAYDLFVIGIASTLISRTGTSSAGPAAMLNSVMLGGGVPRRAGVRPLRGRGRPQAGVLAGRRDHDRRGHRIGAGPGSFWVLIGFRFLLGFGVGGDYPVSAVMVSEYANRKDRGKLVGMVFGTQALGLIVGPLVALALLGSGVSNDVDLAGPAGARAQCPPPP